MVDDESGFKQWTVFRCGMVGIWILGVMVGIKFLAAIPRLFQGNWTWNELLVLPLQILVLGFATGAALGTLLPLTRLGRVGDAIIGAVGANVYLFVCFALFDAEALLHPRVDTTLALAGCAAFLGAGLGIAIGHDLRKPPKDEST